jgi:hypothetical protein
VLPVVPKWDIILGRAWILPRKLSINWADNSVVFKHAGQQVTLHAPVSSDSSMDIVAKLVSNAAPVSSISPAQKVVPSISKCMADLFIRRRKNNFVCFCVDALNPTLVTSDSKTKTETTDLGKHSLRIAREFASMSGRSSRARNP